MNKAIVSVRSKDETDTQALVCLPEEGELFLKMNLVYWSEKRGCFIRKVSHEKIMECLDKHYKRTGFYDRVEAYEKPSNIKLKRKESGSYSSPKGSS